MNKLLSKEYTFYFIYIIIIIFLVNKTFSNNYLENLTDTSTTNLQQSFCNEVEKLKKSDIENLSKINDLVKEFHDNKYVKFTKLNISDKFNYFPIGGIIPYFGEIKNIPSGWKICDGTDGTPNLKDRFILGRSKDYEINNRGGESTVKLIKENMPKHDHKYSPRNISYGNTHNHMYYDAWTTFSSDSNLAKASKGIYKESDRYTAYLAAGSEKSNYQKVGDVNTDVHKHKHTISSKGGTNSHNNMPPYYELIYIIRVKKTSN